AWAEAQKDALRRRSANEVDWDNVADEVGDVGGNIVRACESQVINILAHFLKIEFSGASEPLNHWHGEIGAFRLDLERDLTPTINARMPGRLEKLYEYAVRAARNDCLKRNELPFVSPDACPYSWDDLLGRISDWTPTPRL